MKSFLLNIFNDRIVSPWWILLIDLVITINAFIIAFTLRLGTRLDSVPVSDLFLIGAWVVLIYLTSFFIFRSYKGVIRHSSYNELKILVISCFSAFVCLTFVNLIVRGLNMPWIKVPNLILIMHFLLTAILTFVFRVIVKETYSLLTKKRKTKNIYIYGAGVMGQITLEAITSDKENQYNIVGFIDDDPSKKGVILQSIPVVSWEKALNSADIKDIEEIILAINNIDVQRKYDITDECLRRNWKLKVMPSVGNWVNGISNNRQIRDIRIEDILGREEIKLDQLKIMDGLEGKVVMVTGAAGSIGSEIVRQLLKFPVKKILLVDVAESPLYDLQQELLLSHYDIPFETILVSVTNEKRMEEVFLQFQPNLIFNAAAYKHVPLLEKFPYEAIRVNIGGTRILAKLAVKYGIEKFVMISTDKAVNPTNVMGASKRICEIFIQSLSQKKGIKTSFITTRFGNVLGSNGSVVPLFKKQIDRGGPVTVTDPNITRYFMTIPEACQLVLEAGFMGNGGEIFVFDMGEPVKIKNLAEEMIRLAGLKVGHDIEIKYTGLRPGEKLTEELLASKENTLPTHHDKIMIGQVRDHDYKQVNESINNLVLLLSEETTENLVLRMKELVPEFISNNSIYSELDKKEVLI